MVPDLSILSVIISVATALGGILAFRLGFGKMAADTQEQAINALNAINATQLAQIAAHEKEIARLHRIVATIQSALKRRGLLIEIDGDSITFVDEMPSRRGRPIRLVEDEGEEIS